jgi:hypothetical protein
MRRSRFTLNESPAIICRVLLRARWTMRVSSRTPEGESSFCRVCGKPFVLDPSAAGDAPCPRCGSLAWFDLPSGEVLDNPSPGSEVGVDAAPAFLHIRPTTAAVPVAIDLPSAEVNAGVYRWGRLLRPFVGRWSRRRRERDRERLFRLLMQVSWCASREDLESLIGAPRLLFVDEGGFRNELYEPEAGNVVLRYRDDILIAMFGMIPFSSLEWGAGLEPERNWQELTPPRAFWTRSTKIAR